MDGAHIRGIIIVIIYIMIYLNRTLDGREQVRLAETAKVLLEENVRHL